MRIKSGLSPLLTLHILLSSSILYILIVFEPFVVDTWFDFVFLFLSSLHSLSMNM